MQKIKVLKFGGTSMGSVDSIKKIANIIIEKQKLNKICVVVSACSGVTDSLLKMIDFAKKQKPNFLSKELKNIEKIHYDILFGLIEDEKKVLEIWNKDFKSRIEKLKKILLGISCIGDIGDRTIAYILSFGERLSSFLLMYYLKQNQIEAIRINSKKVIITDHNYLHAKYLIANTKSACKKNILPFLEKNSIPIITGFFGKSTNGDITLLGRGGSDYSATIIGASIDAEEIEIWTDVDGIMSADPKILKSAKSIDIIDTDIASEMALAGAKVLHPKTIEPTRTKNIPIRILNTFNQKFPGTIIKSHKGNGVVGIALKRNNIIIDVRSSDASNNGFISSISTIVTNHDIFIDVCATSEASFSFSISNQSYSEKLLNELKKIGEISIIENIAKIAIIGYGIARDQQIISSIFEKLKSNQIEIKMLSISASPNNISIMIDQKDSEKVIGILE